MSETRRKECSTENEAIPRRNSSMQETLTKSLVPSIRKDDNPNTGEKVGARKAHGNSRKHITQHISKNEIAKITRITKILLPKSYENIKIANNRLKGRWS